MAENKDILAIVKILRKVTVIVKVYPFVYALLYIISMIGYIVCEDSVSILLDQLFYTSPIVVSCNILLSFALKLCKWHRLQCCLPMFPLIPVAIDNYICCLSRVVAITNVVTIITLCIASLINVYFVFIKPNTK
jgi:hypothetical protein